MVDRTAHRTYAVVQILTIVGLAASASLDEKKPQLRPVAAAEAEFQSQAGIKRFRAALTEANTLANSYGGAYN